ncbi:MAG TPA: hypothetical protein VNE39_03040, partial [Planctomycetota bacterium]|nr:hypothetical protein [Planctomycetota bacterium]
MNRTIIHRKNDLALGHGAEELAGGLETIQRLSRRRFLATAVGAAVGALAAKSALADKAVTTGQFLFPRLQFSVYDNTPDIWNAGPVGDVNLRVKLRELTNINA